jgi:UDP-glucose 4-epimerase
MPRALVTGASGFIGSALSSAMLEAGWELATLQRTVLPPAHPRMTSFSADLRHLRALSETLKAIPPVAAIVHLAALLPNGAPTDEADYLAANGAATAIVLEWGQRHKTPVLVYASSTAVIGTPSEVPITELHPTRPADPYGAGKLAGEVYCEQARRSSDLRTVSLRIGSPYGEGMPGRSVLPVFAGQALRGETLAYYGSGAREQVFVHVRDVVAAIMLAISSRAGGIFNVTGPGPISMKQLAGTIARLSGHQRASVAPAGTPDPQEQVRWPVSLDKSARELGYRPRVSLEAGLSEYLAARRTAVEGHR